MTIRTFVATLALALAGLVSVPAHAAPTADVSIQLTHPCTRTSSGTCIRGGQFCPRSSYGHSGWDAHGRRYVCKGNRTHPHWMLP